MTRCTEITKKVSLSMISRLTLLWKYRNFLRKNSLDDHTSDLNPVVHLDIRQSTCEFVADQSEFRVSNWPVELTGTLMAGISSWFKSQDSRMLLSVYSDCKSENGHGRMISSLKLSLERGTHVLRKRDYYQLICLLDSTCTVFWTMRLKSRHSRFYYL